ncbi:MAG: pentapeptide repeat-containing protein [Roseomonas sp.]|nr:pentapeptide repeat-containing protein [Roseomonas sp.]
MSAFDPPPYISKLIGAINDGAKSAQLGALVFVFIGLFLLATSFSATDEDLLIGTSISISQLGGVAVPVALSFGFMPAIFVALHLYTLIRFDLLMQNLRHFEAELRAHVPRQRDRDRCLQLLANTEFIQAAVQPEASFVFRWTYRFMLAVFPVAVLLLVQLGSLRLQSDVVNIVHHITILLDILLLIWFFRRQRPSGDSVLLWLFKRGRFVLPALVLGFNFAWCRVPSAEATTVGAGKWEELKWELFGLGADRSDLNSKQRVDLAFASLRQPVDLLLCPHVGLGCRYLSVPGRTLVGKVWDNRTFVELRAGEELNATRRAAFERLVLQNKRLRFANLSRSQFFNVDLTGADLRGATLRGAFMQQAQLNGAQLQGAWLVLAQLQGASLREAQLRGASLAAAQMQGASLDWAQLQGASLDWAQLQGATLDRAQLQGALLNRAQLQGASLDGAQLQGALITGAQLWRLRAPNAALHDAQLRDLEFSDVAPCADRVWRGEACPNPRNWPVWVQAWLDAIPEGAYRAAAEQRLSVLTAPQPPDDAEAEGGAWHKHPTPAPEDVANRLGALACGANHAPHIARGILRQIGRDDGDRKLGEYRRSLAARMLSDDCLGARGLGEFERARLTAIAAGHD